MRKKFIIVTTIPLSLNFFRGQLNYLNKFFKVCAVSSCEEQLYEIAAREGISYHCIPIKRPISILHDFISLFRFIIFFLKERPEIVHGNTPKGSMIAMFAAWLTRVPTRIYMCHGLRYQGEKGVFRWLLQSTERLSCSCSTNVICVSHGVERKLREDKIAQARKLSVVCDGSPSGIDMDFFNSSRALRNIRLELRIPKNDFIFIYVGRVVGDKGINELIHAFSRLSKEIATVHLILVGEEEPYLDPIRQDVVAEIDLNSRIYAVGKQADVRPYLSSADAFVFPSYREGFGMVLIEAQAMGVPCISSDIIGCNEIIIPGENGELIPSKDENALYERMKDWGEHPEKVTYMASNCRRLVEERYEQKKIWDALKKTYCELCEKQ